MLKICNACKFHCFFVLFCFLVFFLFFVSLFYWRHYVLLAKQFVVFAVPFPEQM